MVKKGNKEIESVTLILWKAIKQKTSIVCIVKEVTRLKDENQEVQQQILNSFGANFINTINNAEGISK